MSETASSDDKDYEQSGIIDEQDDEDGQDSNNETESCEICRDDVNEHEQHGCNEEGCIEELIICKICALTCKACSTHSD
eukprot:IDg14624t1